MQAPARQTLELPPTASGQAVPSGWSPVTPQAGRPVAQRVATRWHGVATPGGPAWPAAPSQAAPSTQAPQLPARQTASAPQEAPSASATPESRQVERPVAQEVAPAWHGLAGTQARPAAQATQPPPWQTRSAPQPVPSERLTAVSWQTGAPEPQAMAPAWQGLAAAQAWPARQGTQPPAPSQTRSAPQARPGAAEVMGAAQTA